MAEKKIVTIDGKKMEAVKVAPKEFIKALLNKAGVEQRETADSQMKILVDGGYMNVGVTVGQYGIVMNIQVHEAEFENLKELVTVLLREYAKGVATMQNGHPEPMVISKGSPEMYK